MDTFLVAATVVLVIGAFFALFRGMPVLGTGLVALSLLVGPAGMSYFT